MKIKELEELTGIDRANIRFYEKEGFITPIRLENKYREYSQDDCDVLLRIKLLRSLNISLEEIHKISDGKTSLSVSLSKKISELNKDEIKIQNARKICEVIKNDNPIFKDLDANKYLNYKESIPEYVGETCSYQYPYYPFRRFFARCMDLTLYDLIITLIFQLGFNINVLQSSGWTFFITILTFLTMWIVEPILIKCFGTTFGKLIFGLEITYPDGRKLNYYHAGERTSSVIVSGYGIFIPIYNLVRLWKSYKQCSENEVSDWDDNLCYKVKDTKFTRGIICIAIFIGFFVVQIGANMLSITPINRGDVTKQEFIENYNRLNDYIIGNDYVMDDSGAIKQMKVDSQYTIYLTSTLVPMLEYGIDGNGNISKISFTSELKDTEEWYNMETNFQIITAMSLIGASKDIRIFSNDINKIAETAAQNYDSYSQIIGGYTISQTVEMDGFSKGFSESGMLIPEDDEKPKNYYKKIFSITKD